VVARGAVGRVKPAISVVVPCLNESATLPHCLDALRAQDYPQARAEVLVVDGRSTDGCAQIARSRGVRILEDPGEGPSAARNVGIRGARGEIVAFTDADCIPEAGWLSAIADAFARRPWIGGVGGAIRMPRRTLLGRLEDDDARARYRGVITSNVAYRRPLLLAVGGFDESLSCAEDYDLAWRLRDLGHEVVHDPGPVVVHDPPEISGSLAAYLRKQFWYARHDVPTHARAIVRGRAGAPGAREAAAGVAGALPPAGLLAVAAGGALAGSATLALAGLAGCAARATVRVVRAGGRSEAIPRAAVATAKELARGAGTLVGLADLARPRVRDRVSRPAPAPLRATPGAAPRPQAS
jgi:mycofactocin glycosyltransferase